ncbi:ornithine carbamoyltransferase [Methylopila turkensis]|uniref:Ornithine carbamoyltransferase n=1 Tax=Methylopila turkensis TaxID=1437816 RepID=A0A9W6JQ50_9HYPH|nr:ornithine carbamoyltransferase [Methylopila turkensis]GLK81706.1 ornithine carbamoyltransferase [Methylopila turkensis]
MTTSVHGNGSGASGPKHFLDLCDFSGAELRAMLDSGLAMKRRRRTPAAAADRPLAGKVVAMVFEQPSLRTRMSFDVGIRELGGEPMMVTGKEIELGEREAIADTARVLSRFVDAIMIRTLRHDLLLDLAANATVPVINGLTKLSHPCQVMADLLTFEERKGDIAGRTVAWTGDFNNVLASWMHAAARFDFRLNVATPDELGPRSDILDWARGEGADIRVGSDPEQAVDGADAVITDSWVSMGDSDWERRHNLLKPYQVNAALMRKAAPDAIFLHCLPAHRGEEVTDEIIDGPQSAVFDEAENRLHAQKGVLAWCFGAV